MPASPWDFPTLSRSSRIKLLGGNIQEVDTAYGYPGDFTWAEEIHRTFFSGGYAGGGAYANWVKPQIQNFKTKHGGNCIRMPGAVRAVLAGIITQSQLNANYTQLCTDARSLGMTLGLNMGANNTSWYGGFSTAAWCTVVQDLFVNVLLPNQDVVAYVEPGTQESDFGGAGVVTQTAAILSTMQAWQASNGYTISLLISAGGTVAGFITAGCNPDVWGYHQYPQFSGLARNWQATLTDLDQSAMQTNTVKKPVLFEEFGIKFVAPYTTFQDKADWFQRFLEVYWGHPDVVGMLPWTGQGPGFDGDWQNYTNPGFPTSWNSDPTVWGATVASDVFKNWTSTNKDYNISLGLNGSQAITSTSADLNLNLFSAATDNPTQANIDFAISFLTFPVKARAFGTFSATGDAGTIYTLKWRSTDRAANIQVIGSTTWTGNAINVPFDFSATLTTQTLSDFEMSAQATGGSLVSGTLTALPMTYVIGDAPGIPGKSRRLIFGSTRPSIVLPMAASIGLLKNPKLTRRRALNPLLWAGNDK